MDQTTRFACVPDLAMAFLTFSLAESTEFKIVVDDIAVHKEVLPKGNHQRSLKDILANAPVEPTGEEGIFTPQPSFGFSHQPKKIAHPHAPRMFKAVFRKTDGSNLVVATFEFALLDSDSFARQMERYDEAHTPVSQQIADCKGGKSCWQCGSFIPKGRCTCPNCYTAQDTPLRARHTRL
jgi:hypothetical protein